MYRDYLKSLYKNKPQIHVLTNMVTSAFVADVLLAVGCRPVMAFDAREVAEITAASQGLCINTGTPHEGIMPGYPMALRSAARHRIPVALDFPGAGASALRQDLCKSLLEILSHKPEGWLRLIRSNGSEILSLSGTEVEACGIDSCHNPELALKSGRHLLHCADAVCVSGAINHIISEGYQQVAGGSALMSKSTGFGCISTALMAAFLSVSDAVDKGSPGSCAATVCMLMRDVAEAITPEFGPASFKRAFIDKLYFFAEDSV
ncbi:MAG: hydroxyethylthiazole kinase [Desulfuromusa sp.]|nr:hydroxyethylthiazole kinase [Desulfuromusa sp.]